MQTRSSRVLWNLLPQCHATALALAGSNGFSRQARYLLPQPAANGRAYSVQHAETLHGADDLSGDQKPHSAPITPDSSTAGQQTSDGRSSQTTSTMVLLLLLVSTCKELHVGQWSFWSGTVCRLISATHMFLCLEACFKQTSTTCGRLP